MLYEWLLTVAFDLLWQVCVVLVEDLFKFICSGRKMIRLSVVFCCALNLVLCLFLTVELHGGAQCDPN